MAPAAKPVRAVVGIGASAGGIEALTQLLRRFTHNTSAFVVALHLSSVRESKLAEVLARTTTLKVVRAQDGDELVWNNVYVLAQEARAFRGRVWPFSRRVIEFFSAPTKALAGGNTVLGSIIMVAPGGKELLEGVKELSEMTQHALEAKQFSD